MPSSHTAELPSRDEVRAAFAEFDKDNSGTLTVDELVGVFTRPGGGKPATEAEARAFIESHDTNGDGVLSLEEFVNAMLPPPHFGPAALMDSIESEAIAPLSGRWVASQPPSWRLLRRQDLPPEAFFPVEKLRRLVKALGDDWGLLFVALSYRCAYLRACAWACPLPA